MNRRSLLGRFRRPAPQPPDSDLDVPGAETGRADPLPPGRLQGQEVLYGYVIGLELLAVAVLTVLVRHGTGAPRHLSTADEVEMALGFAATVAYVALLRLRNRTVATFGAIVAAYVLALVPGPNWLREAHTLAVLPPFVYAIVVFQRQRKALKAVGANRGRAGRSRPAPDRAAAQRGRSAPASSPRRTGRYTPPKAKRAATKRGR